MSICAATESMFHGSHWPSDEWQCSDGNLGFSTDLPSKSEFLKILRNADEDPTLSESRTDEKAKNQKCKNCSTNHCQCIFSSNPVSSAVHAPRTQVSVEIGQLWSKKSAVSSGNKIRRPVAVVMTENADGESPPDDKQQSSNERHKTAASDVHDSSSFNGGSGKIDSVIGGKNVDVLSSREFRKEDKEFIQEEIDTYRYSLKARLALDVLKKRDEKDLYRFEYAGNGVLTKLGE
uniref:Uncharacterized protein n=1 Tax=Romanomermis culicivorax TaxID=13658 RepID=A0A915INT8_ROMCU